MSSLVVVIGEPGWSSDLASFLLFWGYFSGGNVMHRLCIYPIIFQYITALNVLKYILYDDPILYSFDQLQINETSRLQQFYIGLPSILIH